MGVFKEIGRDVLDGFFPVPVREPLDCCCALGLACLAVTIDGEKAAVRVSAFEGGDAVFRRCGVGLTDMFMGDLEVLFELC